MHGRKGEEVGKKNRIKKPSALLTQAKAHELYVRRLGKFVSPEVVKHWVGERERHLKEAEKRMEGLPPAYLEEIDRESDEQARKMYEKKRKEIAPS